MAAELAAAAGAELISDFDDASHVAAALTGIAAAEAAGANCVALLPGDCPLLDPRELDKIADGRARLLRRRDPGPAWDRDPTRWCWRRRARSCRASARAARSATSKAARAAGIPYAVEEQPSLGLDLDTPADIVALTTRVEMSGGGKWPKRSSGAAATALPRWRMRLPCTSRRPSRTRRPSSTSRWRRERASARYALPEAGAYYRQAAALLDRSTVALEDAFADFLTAIFYFNN